jgi:L-serine deaminase
MRYLRIAQLASKIPGTLSLMTISIFDLFKIGIGPSSSHTVGPMKAARLLCAALQRDGLLPKVAAVRTELFGSLGATGKGHGTDKAVILGLLGEEPGDRRHDDRRRPHRRHPRRAAARPAGRTADPLCRQAAHALSAARRCPITPTA